MNRKNENASFQWSLKLALSKSQCLYFISICPSSSHASYVQVGWTPDHVLYNKKGRRKLVPQMPDSKQIPLCLIRSALRTQWLLICLLRTLTGSFGGHPPAQVCAPTPAPAEAPRTWKPAQRLAAPQLLSVSECYLLKSSKLIIF